MTKDYKLLIGVVIGLVAALGIGFIAFKAGQMSDALPPEPVQSSQSTTTTINESTTKDEASPETLPDGQVKVTGTYREDVAGLFPNALVFTTSTSATNLPKGTGFYFNNYTNARALLKISQAGKLGSPGCDFISGKAEIIISDYKPQDNTQSESVNSAKLISVSNILTPAQCGRITSN